MKFLIALAILFPSLAFADDRPYPSDQGAHDFTAANTAEVVQYTDRNGNTGPACFKYDQEVKLHAVDGKVVASFVIDDAVTYEGNVGAANQAILDDNAVTFDGASQGAQMVQSERETVRLDYKSIFRSPGARSGLCTLSMIGPGRKRVRQGCDTNADCAVGTCDTSGSITDDIRKKFGCGILVVQASSAAAMLYWRTMEAAP